jgi:hypothetical protein
MQFDELQSWVEDSFPEAQGKAGNWIIDDGELTVQILADPNFGRMRIIISLNKISEVDPSIYSRLLQANFESTLDARYAISNGYIWSVFIHPLESLNEDLLDSGYLQTLTAAQTFGTSYTSGVASFGKGSDPAAAEFAMLQELKRTNRLM